MRKRPSSRLAVDEETSRACQPEDGRGCEAGDTLIELLIAVAVLGVVVGGMLLAFSTSILSSAEYRNLATMDSVLRSAATEATSQIQAQGNAAFTCVLPADPFVTFALPPTYTATLAVSYWSGSASTNTCAVNAPQLVTITATSSSNNISQSITFVVDDPGAAVIPTATAATHLVFLASPGNATAGTVLSPQPVIAVLDSANRFVTNDLSPISVTLTPVVGQTATLADTCQGTEIGGVVSFSGCTVTTAGSYTLSGSEVAPHSGVAPAVSTTFNVTPGIATLLAFTASPDDSTGGTPFAAQPLVTVEDAFGNQVVTDTSAVSLTVSTNSGAGDGTLTCTTDPVSAVQGVATFAGCSIDAAAPGYTLSATDGLLAAATSAAFDVTAGVGAQLAFAASPGNSTGGTPFSTQSVVTIEDAGGNTAATDTSAVTLTISTNPGAGNLTCTTNPVRAVNGVAVFAGCNINRSGSGYVLTATDGALDPVSTAPFDVTAGPATQLVFGSSPGGGSFATAFATQPVVRVVDAGGNVVSSTAAVTLAVNSGTGSLTCAANPVSAAGGSAAFAACKLSSGTAGAFTLKATAAGLTTATTTAFNVTAGAPTRLVFTTAPGNSTGGTSFATQPVAAIEDAGGNIVTSSTVSVALAVNSGTGTLACTTNPVTAAGGVAAYAGCRITLGTPGAFTLKATATGLTTAVSSTFTVAGPATQLVFTTSPGNSSFGTVWNPQPVVTVEDATGDQVTTSTASVTLAANSGNPTGGSCTASTVTAVSGRAAFAGCSFTSGTAGPFSVKATATGLVTGVSSTFTMSAGPATQLVFTSSPGSSTHNVAFGTQPVVAVEDVSGNTVSTDTSTVLIALGANPGSATLTCATNPVNATAGVAGFAGCRVSRAGNGYTLSATDGTLTSTTSTAFNAS